MWDSPSNSNIFQVAIYFLQSKCSDKIFSNNSKIDLHLFYDFRNINITNLNIFVKIVDKSCKLLIYWFKMEMFLFVALDDGTSQTIFTTQRISQISSTLSINKQGTSFIFFEEKNSTNRNTMISNPY